MALSSVSCVVPLTTTSTVIHQSQLPKLTNVSFTMKASSGLVSNSDGYYKIEARFGSLRSGGGGTNVLERPNFDQSQFDPATQLQQGGDIGRVKDKKTTGGGDSYKVILIDDARHTEKLVVKALPQAVPGVTPDDAIKLFHVSRENGLAVVLVTVKEHAEFYAQMMVHKGLRSTIEPDSTTV